MWCFALFAVIEIRTPVFKERLHDKFFTEWESTGNVSPKCLVHVYRMYNTYYCFEEYWDILPNHLIKSLLGLRTISCQKGRRLGIERNQRVCTLCNRNSIGDAFHYLFECDHFIEERMKYFTKYYYNHPNSHKLNDLMNCKT